MVHRQLSCFESGQDRGNSPRNQTTDTIIGTTDSTCQRGWHRNQTFEEPHNTRCHPRWKSFVCHTCSVCFTCLSLSYPRIEAHQATVDQWQCCSGRVWYRWFQSSRLDYCNSLLYGTSVDNLSRLQRVQNTLARVVTKSGWRAHSLPILERLHWLPVEHRIWFKIATLTFRALHQNNPPYLHDLISRYTPARTLRSTDKYLLNTRRTNTKIGSRAFSAAAPETWNVRPMDIKWTDSLNKFKIDLKTHLFRIAFK